jgi:hypothetical protein
MQAHEGHAIYSPSGELSNFLAGPKAGPDHKWQGLGPALCIAGAATALQVVSSVYPTVVQNFTLLNIRFFASQLFDSIIIQCDRLQSTRSLFANSFL